MLIRKINPMARAIGTMGAVAALVGAVTFASLTSNTVALAPNQLTTGSASLAIGTSVADATSCNNSGNVAPGLSDSSFNPGDTTSATFCLANTGDVPLVLTASIPQDLSASAAAQNTTLTVTCTTEGTLTAGLNAWGPGTFSVALPAGASDSCTASATLSSSYSGSGGETIPTFAINFVGTEPST